MCALVYAFMRLYVCVCVCMRVLLGCVCTCVCRAGSHLLPDGTSMCLAPGKDGVAKIHEVSADIGFVGLQVAC